MRDDPIVFEDWKIGRTELSNPYALTRLDFILSFIYIAIQFTIGILSENATMVFSWIFALTIALFLEIIYDQYSRSLINRYTLVIGYIALSYFTIPGRYYNYNDNLFDSLSIISGIVLSLKIILIYLITTELRFNENILVPRSEYASIILEEQVLRVQNTEYEMSNNEDFQLRLKRHRIAYRIYLVPAIAILLVLSTLIFLVPGDTETVLFITGFSVTIIASLFLLTMLFVWWNNKRIQRKKYVEEEKVEIVPLFAEIIK